MSQPNYLLARIISSVGFVVSILAICFLWLLPTWKPTAPHIRRRHPPLSKSTPLPPAIIRRSSLIHPAPSSPAPPLPMTSASPRHVSFNLAMSTTPLQRRRTLGTVPSHNDDLGASSSSLRSSASSSSSTLVNTTPDLIHGHDPSLYRLESGDDSNSNMDSDASHFSSTSSMRSTSLYLSTHLPNVKKALINHKRRTSAPPASLRPILSRQDEEPVSPVSDTSRKSTPFRGQWLSYRKDNSTTTVNSISDAESTPKAARPSFASRLSLPRPRTPPTPTSPTSPSFFSRKPERRCSAPVPRTQPYGPPYYAPIPVQSWGSVDGSYSSYLKGLPQFGDELLSPPLPHQEGESSDSSLRGRSLRQEQAAAQAALGIGRPARSNGRDNNAT